MNNKCGSLWVVQLGETGADQSVSYTIKNANAPTIFAPRPISNELKSKQKTPIIEYKTGNLISLQGRSEVHSFTSIDLDKWMKTTLTEIDQLLTPKYISHADILRKNIQDVPANTGWKDALQEVLDAKKSLADKLSAVMIPVFDGESANDQQLKDIRETFYQQLLGSIGQFYTVKAGVQFEVDVQADIILAASTAGDSPVEDMNVSVSSPKLDLKFEPSSTVPAPSSYLSSLVSSTAIDAKNLLLYLDYNGQYIEHEFYVPIVLREFPDTPTLVNQEELSELASSCDQPMIDALDNSVFDLLLTTGECNKTKEGTYDPLATATRWNYAFEYSMHVHRQQDRICGEISFNISDSPDLMAMAIDAPQRDLFDNLAQFTQVYPQVQADLNTFLLPIDIGTKDHTTLQNAQFALESAATMINWIADSFKESEELLMSLAHQGMAPIKFTISEDGVEKENADKTKVTALQVAVKLLEDLPPRIGRPLVEIDSYTCERVSGDDKEKGVFFYKDDKGDYLEASVAKNIPGRKFVLPEMVILERQVVQTEIYLTRNADIVPNKTIAKPFVYSTPKVSFETPLHPTLFNLDKINMATSFSNSLNKAPSPVQRSLECQLTLFYEALFANVGTNDVTLRLELYYEYEINPAIEEVCLPVFLMPPTKTAIREGGSGIPLYGVIMNQVKGWETWFNTHTPQTEGGKLIFDLSVMSDLTERPMPILKMTGLYLPVTDLELKGSN